MNTCRDIKELLPVAQEACRLLFQECFKAGITNIFITETYRSPERQLELYSQGRTRPGQKVTWTLKSNHSSRLAWDIAVSPPKSLYDVNTLNRVGEIACKLGITWGGTWKETIDRPHFEIKRNWKAPSGYEVEGEVIVPTDSKTKVNLIRSGSVSVLIQTGGLGYNDIEDVSKFCLERKWAFSIDYDGKGNPKALVGRLNTKRQREFENWLKGKNWWYKVIE